MLKEPGDGNSWDDDAEGKAHMKALNSLRGFTHYLRRYFLFGFLTIIFIGWHPFSPALPNDDKILDTNELLDSGVPDGWYSQFQEFLRPSRAILDAFSEQTLKVKLLAVSWNGHLEYSHERKFLSVGLPMGCKSDKLEDSFVFSMHEVGHILLLNSLSSLNLEFGAADKALDFFGSTMSTSAITRPYGELFADAFVVFAHFDPEIMTAALNRCEIATIETTDSKSRSFSEEHNLERWHNKTLHQYFDPVRSYIYREIFLKRYKGVRSAAPHILKATAQAIKNVVRSKRIANLTEEEWAQLSSAETNKELMRAIDSQL